ncbi:TcaA NTF2-like domain-containing protein [Intestinibacter sp.]
MYCRNCGTNNRNGIAYCANCGEPLSGNMYNSPGSNHKKSSNDQTIKIVSLIVSVCLVLCGGFLLLKDTIFGSDVAINGITVDGDYKMQGDTYIFCVNETVVLEPKVDSSNDKVNLRYEIEDSSAANIVKLDNKCSIVGNAEKQTNLNIYEGDKILKVVKISFEDNSKDDNEEDSKPDNNIAKNNITTNKNKNNTNTTNKSNTSHKGTTNPNNNNSSSSSIPLEELTYFMSQYFNFYVEATTYGDFSMVSEKLTNGGKLYKQLEKSIPDIYNKGILLELKSVEKVSAKKVSNGVYSLTYTVDYIIYNPEQETTRVQREYADYIVKQSGSDFKLDRMENWQILSKQYI